MAEGGDVILSADGLFTGTGHYMMAKDQLAKFWPRSMTTRPDVDAWFETSAPKGRIVSFLETAKPLVTWLDTHVGPTEIVDPRWG